MVRNFGEKRKRKGKNKTKASGPKGPRDYPGPRQEDVTCREVAIYTGPIDDDDSAKRSRRSNRRDFKRDDSRSEPKQQREPKQRRPAPGRYGTRNPRAYFFDVTDNEESDEDDYEDDEDGEYEYIRNRPRRREDDDGPAALVEFALLSMMMERVMVNETRGRRGGRSNSSSGSSTNSFMDRLASMFSR